MVLAEFGDRTQIFSLTMSSIHNLSGVLIGSFLPWFFLIYGIQIFIGKKMSGQ